MEIIIEKSGQYCPYPNVLFGILILKTAKDHHDYEKIKEDLNIIPWNFSDGIVEYIGEDGIVKVKILLSANEKNKLGGND